MQLLGEKLTDPNFKSALNHTDQRILSLKMQSAWLVSPGKAKVQAMAFAKAKRLSIFWPMLDLRFPKISTNKKTADEKSADEKCYDENQLIKTQLMKN